MGKPIVDIPAVVHEQIKRILALSNAPTELSDEVIAALSNERQAAFRVNTLITEVAQVVAKLAELKIEFAPVAWSSFSFTLEHKSSLSRSSLASQGLVYLQNLASQLTIQVLQPKANQFILDLAAAPGGKTSLIAQMMGNCGRISAVEPVKDRYYRLIANLKQLGVTIARCYQKDGRVVGKLCPQWFDQVLLDAPCSSMAQIDLRDPASYAHWNLKKVKECARKQKQLIISAFDSLQEGGEMVYSTCSWMIEENEEVVQHLLTTYPDKAQLIPFDLPITNYLAGVTSNGNQPLHESMPLTRRVIPTKLYEAFYIAKIRKIAS